MGNAKWETGDGGVGNGKCEMGNATKENNRGKPYRNHTTNIKETEGKSKARYVTLKGVLYCEDGAQDGEDEAQDAQV